MQARQWIRASAVVAALGGAGAVPASAQLHDHLECYKIKDTAAFTAVVDLRPTLDSPFQLDAGCTVKVHSRQLCFPVAKEVVSTNGPTLDVNGQELANAFLCYSVKCPAADTPASLQMSDQFGTRTLTGMHTSTICAPAVVGVPPPTTTTTTTIPMGTPKSCVDATPPNCDGTCNDYNLACAPDGLGSCYCQNVDVWGPCSSLRGNPECIGSCDGAQSCIDVSGACQCGLVVQ